MKGIEIIFFTCLFLCPPLMAGEVYIWTDESGIKHITDTPPPERKTVKLIEKSRYKNDSPAEIRAFEQKNKAAIDAAHARIQAEERARQANILNERARNEARSEASTRRAEIQKREGELRAIVDSIPGLSDTQRGALEAAAKKGEINRLQQQDPNYRPSPKVQAPTRPSDNSTMEWYEKSKRDDEISRANDEARRLQFEVDRLKSEKLYRR